MLNEVKWRLSDRMQWRGCLGMWSVPKRRRNGGQTACLKFVVSGLWLLVGATFLGLTDCLMMLTVALIGPIDKL